MAKGGYWAHSKEGLNTQLSQGTTPEGISQTTGGIISHTQLSFPSADCCQEQLLIFTLCRELWVKCIQPISEPRNVR